MMKNLKTFKAVLVTLTLTGIFGASAVNAAESKTDPNTLLATQLQLNAHYSMAEAMEENLNQVVVTINASVKKELKLNVYNTSSLVGALAKSQSVKDDKVTSAVGE